jgi:hypothetical protein
MARHLFGGGIADWTFDLGDPATAGSGAEGNLAVVVPAVVVTFYDAATTGTQYSDLTDVTGGAITSITSDTSGELGQCYGPDNVYAMWADASGGAGPRRLMVATDLGPDVEAMAEQLANLQNTVANLVELSAYMPVVIREVSGVIPPRPAIAGDRMGWWICDDTPTSGGTGMAENDILTDTAP